MHYFHSAVLDCQTLPSVVARHSTHLAEFDFSHAVPGITTYVSSAIVTKHATHTAIKKVKQPDGSGRSIAFMGRVYPHESTLSSLLLQIYSKFTTRPLQRTISLFQGGDRS